MRIAQIVAVFALSLPVQALACTCDFEPLEDVFARSEQVFTARVTSVRLTSIQPIHNEIAQYVATFERQRTFKGMQADTFEVAFEMRWHDPEAEFKIVTSCDWGFEEGDEYLFLRNEWSDFELSFCSSQLHPVYRVDMDEVESLAAQGVDGVGQANTDSGAITGSVSDCDRAA